jgi:hypothetical protein
MQPVTLKRTPQIPLPKTSNIPQPAAHFALAALTLCTLLIHGYHPFAEDGGIYVAGIESSLKPSLFPHDHAFVDATRHYSLFTPIIATAVRATHIPLPWLLLFANFIGIWLILYATWRVAAQYFHSQRAQLCATALTAAWFTLPIAGTSLYLMDPYVTARTFSTPLSILAIALALNTKPTQHATIWRTAICLAAAAIFHPLMAAYAAAFIAALLIAKLPSRRSQILGWTILTAAAVLIATILQATAPAESTSIAAAAFSRPYWFLSQWQWFELLGIAGPLVIFTLLLRFARNIIGQPGAALCRASIAIGCIATLISLLFAQASYSAHIVARLQPLREFLLLYAIMIPLLGGVLANLTAHRRSLRLTAPLFLIAMACVMFFVQRQTYPGSQHLELPWRAPTNPWSQAFVWSRENTPTDALFAIDANYITTDNEDGQTFRATAQRSILPDFSKDGGESAIRPSLAAAWLAGSTLQRNLSTIDDTQRDARLQPQQVTWMILHSSAPTTHACPYNNGTIKVCRLTP